MNAAWGGQIGGNQISISLSAHRTTDNIKKHGEFTVAFATAETIAACGYVGIVSGNKVSDKLGKCGFTVIKSDNVDLKVCLTLWQYIESYDKVGYEINTEDTAVKPDNAFTEDFFSLSYFTCFCSVHR